MAVLSLAVMPTLAFVKQRKYGADRCWALLPAVCPTLARRATAVRHRRSVLPFSGWGRTREAAPGAAWVAAGRVTSWSAPRRWAASGVAGSWFGVCGSWSRMRHQRAAAGWSSGRGPAAAADRTSRVASKPARVRLRQPFLQLGQEWVCGGAGGLRWRAVAAIAVCVVSAAASRLSSCCWKIRAAWPSWGGPVGRRSLGSTWVAARHTCTSAISSAGTERAAGPPRPAFHLRRCGGPGRRAQQPGCDRASRYGPQLGSAAMPVGNARQPRQRAPGGDPVDVLDPRVDDSSLIIALVRSRVRRR